MVIWQSAFSPNTRAYGSIQPVHVQLVQGVCSYLEEPPPGYMRPAIALQLQLCCVGEATAVRRAGGASMHAGKRRVAVVGDFVVELRALDREALPFVVLQKGLVRQERLRAVGHRQNRRGIREQLRHDPGHAGNHQVDAAAADEAGAAGARSSAHLDPERLSGWRVHLQGSNHDTFIMLAMRIQERMNC